MNSQGMLNIENNDDKDEIKTTRLNVLDLSMKLHEIDKVPFVEYCFRKFDGIRHHKLSIFMPTISLKYFEKLKYLIVRNNSLKLNSSL